MAEDYRKTSEERVNEICDEIKDSLDEIFTELPRNKKGEKAAHEMDQIAKNVNYLKTFALAGAKQNVNGIEELLNSKEES